MLATLAIAAGATAANALEDKYFDSGGVKIRYVEYGSGEPVILLHGYASNIENGWIKRGVFGQLAKGYRVIAFDARGHGKSGKSHDPAQYGGEMGRDVIRLMDHLDLPKAHVLGYSMGAHVAAQLVTRSPERFLSLVLGGAPGRLDWTTYDEERVDEEASEMDQGLLTSQILRLWPKDQPQPSAEALKGLSAKRLKGMDPKALAAVRRSNPGQVVSLAEMGDVKVPVLGIVGSADPYQRDFEKLKSAMPHMQLVLVAGASHSNAASRPEFVAAVKDFLRSHVARTD